LAKFKKKKSEPMPEPENSKPKIGDDIGTPEIEKSTSVSDSSNDPSKNSPIDQAEKNAKDKKLAKLFWMRIVLAISAGVITTFIFEDIEGEERRWASIGFMIIIFFASIIVAKGMKMQLPHSDRKKLVTQGIGSYVFLYLFSWIVSYTLTHLGDTPIGINL
jgi:multidrug transporter EmrE-like cation transporter